LAQKNENKKNLMQLLVEYLSETSPLMLLIHLVYIMLVCTTLSVSYIVSFHWGTVIQIYNDAHDIRQFGNNLKISVENDNKLNDTLTEIMTQTGGIRAYIYRYHNGLAAINSVPFFFQTNTHEVISPGTARLLPYEQRIPASFNPYINNHFIKNQCVIVFDANQDPNSQNYYYYQSRQAKAFARCPIFMPNGDLFGFVGVDYVANPDKEKVEQIISDAASKLGVMFSSLMTTD
jgi:hypothetical protein